MTELTRQHHDLAAVMPLVRDEIRENMGDIEGQVAPDVRLGSRDMSAFAQPKREERLDPSAAPAKRGKQLTSRCLAAVGISGNGNPVFPAERLEPHASRVV